MWTRSKINQYKDKAKLYFFAAILIDKPKEQQNSTDSSIKDAKAQDFGRIKQRISTLLPMADSFDNFTCLLLALPDPRTSSRPQSAASSRRMEQDAAPSRHRTG